MPLILFHSSKTMQRGATTGGPIRLPMLLPKSIALADYLKALSSPELAKTMHISSTVADKTSALIQHWNAGPENQSPAIDSFLGDMYSGLQASQLSTEDREYADVHLRILSGLYGILRPFDGVMPYRLEMGYKLAHKPYDDLYSFWTEDIVNSLPDLNVVFNLSSVEYTKALLPHLKDRTIITPVFMTIDDKTGKPRQVVVHSKIARGAYVRWLIQNRVSAVDEAKNFNLLGYSYSPSGSTQQSPLFVCNNFRGIGLSVRKQMPTDETKSVQ